MSNLNAVLAQFNKMSEGRVPADGALIVRRAIDENLASKEDVAAYFGVQAKQVIKLAGNLNKREVQKFCSYIVEQNTPS